MDNKLTRRAFLERAAVFSLGAAGAMAFLNACSRGGGDAGGGGGANACDDTTTDTVALGQRTQLQYVSNAPDQTKRCDGCALWQAPAAGAACGGCTAVGGPINPAGTCVAFAPRA